MQELVEGEGFEPPKATANGFTVRSVWPLRYPSMTQVKFPNLTIGGNDSTSPLEPAARLELATCRLQVDCSAD